MKRLTRAIMFSDIVDFSEMMGEDEDMTLDLVEEHNQLIVPLVEEHQGLVVKFLGDGVMSCFESATDAVRCGIAIQQQLRLRNQKVDDDAKKIIIRIGIHIGDVVLKEGDAWGDGVNVASRIEPLAEPGGICISQTVYDMVRAQPTIQTLSIGQQELRHIKQMIHVYKVILEAEGVDLEEDVPPPPVPPPKVASAPVPTDVSTPLLSLEESGGRKWTIAAIGAIVAAVVIIGVIAVFLIVDFGEQSGDTVAGQAVAEQSAVAGQPESGVEAASEEESALAGGQEVSVEPVEEAAPPITQDESVAVGTSEPPPETVPVEPTTGQLRITTDPDGITVYVDGRPVESGPQSLLTFSADERITVHAEEFGYAPFEQEIQIAPGELKELAVNLVPIPKAILTLETEPSGASIRILNITPPYRQGIDLPPGRYQIQVSAEGHETWTEWVDLVDGENNKLVSLEPFGTLIVTTQPADARIRVREIGDNGMSEWIPYEPSLRHKPSSYYEIEIEADGYVPQRAYTSKSRDPVTVNLERDAFTSELYARQDDGPMLYEFMMANSETLAERVDFDALWQLFLDHARALLERDLAFVRAATGPVADHHGHYVDDPRSCEDPGAGGSSPVQHDAGTVEESLNALKAGNVAFWSEAGVDGGEEGTLHLQRLMGERFNYTIQSNVDTSKTFSGEGQFEGIDIITTRGTRFFFYNDGFGDRLWAYSCSGQGCSGNSFSRCP